MLVNFKQSMTILWNKFDLKGFSLNSSHDIFKCHEAFFNVMSITFKLSETSMKMVWSKLDLKGFYNSLRTISLKCKMSVTFKHLAK